MLPFKTLVGVLIWYPLDFILPDGTMPIFGKFFIRLRALILHCINPRISTRANVCRRAYIGNIQTLSIGASGIGTGFEMRNVNLEMGDDIMMARDVLEMGGGHIIDRTDIPMGQQGSLPRTSLTIESDVWIGARALILAKNYTIGHGAVIGAGAVVTRAIPPYAVVGGNPARIIRYRKEEENN